MFLEVANRILDSDSDDDDSKVSANRSPLVNTSTRSKRTKSMYSNLKILNTVRL